MINQDKFEIISTITLMVKRKLPNVSDTEIIKVSFEIYKLFVTNEKCYSIEDIFKEYFKEEDKREYVHKNIILEDGEYDGLISGNKLNINNRIFALKETWRGVNLKCKVRVKNNKLIDYNFNRN